MNTAWKYFVYLPLMVIHRFIGVVLVNTAIAVVWVCCHTAGLLLTVAFQDAEGFHYRRRVAVLLAETGDKLFDMANDIDPP